MEDQDSWSAQILSIAFVGTLNWAAGVCVFWVLVVGWEELFASKMSFVLAGCPGFSWDGVNFHNKLVALTQTASQMGYSIPCDTMLSIEVGSWLKERLFPTQEQAEHCVVRTLHVVYAFISIIGCCFLPPLPCC